MKVVVLCGGRGLRMNEITQDIPKPMVEIKGKPLLWWICEHFKKYGHNDFIFCLGYKGNIIKDYFQNSEFNESDLYSFVRYPDWSKLSYTPMFREKKNTFLAIAKNVC
mgnify:CR=1 FL=1